MDSISYFDDIIKSAIKNVFNELNERTENFRRSFDLLKKIRNKHFQRLELILSSVQILGMSGPTKLTDIYIPTRLSERVSRNFFIDLDMAQSISDIRFLINQIEIDIKEFLNDNDSILILGGPGAGKTTFLSALVLGHAGLCDNAKDYIESPLFPIWVPLRSDPTPPRSFKSIIIKSIAVDDTEDFWPFINRMLSNGNALIVFDGLDEIATGNQTAWRDFLVRFKKKYPNCKLIVSCRSGGLYVDFPGFKHAEVLPFQKEDVNLFIDNWFGEKYSSIATNLKESLKSEYHAFDLTRNPLLLSLLCILFEHDLELPQHRVDLYNRCIDTMLIKWDTSRGFRRNTNFTQLSLSIRRRIFQRIAVELTNSDRTIIYDRSAEKVVAQYIEKYDIEPEVSSQVLAELEAHHGLLIRPAANIYSYSHISFQDYFTAEFIVATRKELDFLRNNATNQRKQDIIVFTACLVEDASHLISEMLSLSDLRGKQNYPTIARRLTVAALMVRTLANGAPMSIKLRNEIPARIIKYFKYATDHLHKTGLNLYCTFVSSECKVRCSWFKLRSTTHMSLLALELLVNEIMNSNHPLIYEYIESALLEKLNYSSRALLSASLIKKSPKIVLDNYRSLILNESLPPVYENHIKSVLIELEAQIET